MAKNSNLTHQLRNYSVKIRLSSEFNKVIQRLGKPLRCSPYMPVWIWKRLPIVGAFPVEVNSGNYFYYQAIGEPTGKTLFWKGIWSFEQGTTSIFFWLAKSAHTFIDVGAYVGLYTLLAKTSNPNVRVYAFEPVPSIYNRLVSHLCLNHIENEVVVEKAAISDSSEEKVPFFVPKHPWVTSSSLISDYRVAENNQIIVRSYALDDYVQKHQISNIDLVKIDVEGAEVKVFEGAQETLKTQRPIIICEVLPQHKINLLRIENILEANGYQMASITSQSLVAQTRLAPDFTRINRNFLLWPSEKYKMLRHIL